MGIQIFNLIFKFVQTYVDFSIRFTYVNMQVSLCNFTSPRSTNAGLSLWSAYVSSSKWAPVLRGGDCSIRSSSFSSPSRDWRRLWCLMSGTLSAAATATVSRTSQSSITPCCRLWTASHACFCFCFCFYLQMHTFALGHVLSPAWLLRCN